MLGMSSLVVRPGRNVRRVVLAALIEALDSFSHLVFEGEIDELVVEDILGEGHEAGVFRGVGWVQGLSGEDPLLLILLTVEDVTSVNDSHPVVVSVKDVVIARWLIFGEMYRQFSFFCFRVAFLSIPDNTSSWKEATIGTHFRLRVVDLDQSIISEAVDSFDALSDLLLKVTGSEQLVPITKISRCVEILGDRGVWASEIILDGGDFITNLLNCWAKNLTGLVLSNDGCNRGRTNDSE